MRNNVLLILASVLITLAGFEIGLRIVGWSAIEPHHLTAQVGWEPIPGVSGTYRRESVAEIRFNAIGLRGPMPTETRPRIVLTGDSFVEAREVPWDQSLAAFLEDRVNGEVLNAGVSGWGTVQSWMDWERRIAPLHPDHVIHFLYLGNDISNNYRSIDRHGDRPFFALDGGGQLIPDGDAVEMTATRSWKNRAVGLRNALRVVQFLRYHWKLLRDGERPDSWQQAVGGAAQADALFAAPITGSDWYQAWAVTEALLIAYRDTVEATGATFTLAVLGMPIQVHPNPLVRSGEAERLSLDSLDYPLNRLRRFCHAHDIGFVDLVSPMQEQAVETGIFFHGFARTAPGYGHWNEDGQRAAANIVADSLVESLPKLLPN